MIIKLKDGRQLNIQKIDPGLSHQALDFLQALYEEKAYVSVTLGSKPLTIEQETQTLKQIDWQNKMMFVAVFNNEIASIIDGHRRENSIERHTADVSASVSKNFRGSGLSHFMMYYLVDRLIKNAIKIVYSGIIADNSSGIKYVKSLGFKELGTVNNGAMAENGKLYNKVFFYGPAEEIKSAAEKFWKNKGITISDSSD